jgi:hypothetical protein
MPSRWRAAKLTKLVLSEAEGLTHPLLRVRARPRAHVAANFDNFGHSDTAIWRKRVLIFQNRISPASCCEMSAQRLRLANLCASRTRSARGENRAVTAKIGEDWPRATERR